MPDAAAEIRLAEVVLEAAGAVRVRVAVIPAKQFAAAKQRLADALPAAGPRRAGARDAGGRPRRGRRGAPRPRPGRHARRGGGRGRGAMGRRRPPGGGGRGSHRRGRARRRALPRVGGDGPPHRPRGPPLPHGRTRCAESSRPAGRAPAAVFVPSRSGLGTNAACLAPPDAVPLRFGEPSFADHLAAARARGIEPVVLPLPGAGLDIDRPEDLDALRQAGPGTRAAAALARRPAARPRRAPRGSRSSGSTACRSSGQGTTSRASRSGPPPPRARRSRTATSWC